MKFLLASILMLTFLTGPVARTKQIRVPTRAVDVDPGYQVCGELEIVMYVYFGIESPLCDAYEDV